MKYYSIPFAIIALFFNAISSNAQVVILPDTLPANNGIVTYSDVIKIDSAKLEELYRRARRWFVEHYKSANNVIQLDDKQNGEIIGKGIIKSHWDPTALSVVPVDINHTVKVQFKDGRYRYEVTNINLSIYNKGYYSSTINVSPSTTHMVVEDFVKSKKKRDKRMLYYVDRDINRLIVSLKTAMLVPSPQTEEW
ncbi:DUF4468 domain-containing protein [Chitinophaga sp. YIM B06452]|uniref:DUF4468 domain-containing protein n=1 Tax=Chitinophaga sp. YIM B06452 TaxID=3082158 RepID=UPI0031FF1236